ncbi:enoyl-CoA hydratase/isomerase family protein [Halobium palmae]|uniref:Enoyl-CoA hydratase/isomerase family protein n=1 Tax=Halobium palmae TaxID=1776492 RepID=A0ABD5RWL9_9EURY
MEVELDTIDVEKEGKIARITLNRPERLNAVDHPLTRDLDAVTTLLEDDRDVRLITIRGAGRAFCSGIDLKKLASGDIDERHFPPWEQSLRRLETMDALVLCFVHGYAIGGGLQLALAADIRVSTDTAEYGLTAIEESIIPGMGTWRLPRYIGLGRAKKMSILGEFMGAEEAHRIGLVDHLVEEDDAEAEFESIVDDYMHINSRGARATKQAMANSFEMDWEEFWDHYIGLQDEARAHEDHDEAKAAYQEDRDPEWS